MAARVRRVVPIHPDAIAVAYYGELRAMVVFVHAYLAEHLAPIFAEVAVKTDAARADAPSVAQRVREVVRNARLAFAAKFPTWKTTALLNRFATRAAGHQRIQLERQVRGTLGIDLGAVVDRGLQPAVSRFTKENVSLISTIPDQYLDEVQDTTLEGLRGGKRASELASDLEDRTGVAKSRAELIARDQIGKFHGELAKLRQANLGVESFRWRTMGDERVRDWHKDREGKPYSWAEGVPDDELEGDGGEDGHFPGEAILCRCWPEAQFSEDQGGEEGADRDSEDDVVE
jgi:SPP1 gp7 family putative phage head morphogenesis protein